MAGLRFTELQSRPMAFLDFTSLTLDEFQQLVLPFETAFHARMAAWRMDGKPRTARRFTVYKNCPLSTPEDRLLFILVYLKTYTLQVVHGRVFGMVQGKANQWIHVLLPALLAALRALGDAPARSLSALAQRLGISEADAATVVVPLEEEPAPVAPIPAAAPASPLLCEFARKKKNPSLERSITTPCALLIVYRSQHADVPPMIASFSAELPVIRGRRRSHASSCLFVRDQETSCASHFRPCWRCCRHKEGDEVAVGPLFIPE